MKALLKFFLFIICLKFGIVKAQNYNEILGRPTNNSITVSVLFEQQVYLYIEYGTSSGVYPFSTSIITNIANTPDEIELQNLTQNTKYYYRTRYRIASTGSFQSSTEHSFHTQRESGSAFKFTIEADEHLYDKKGVKSLYQICLSNQAMDNPDFMISLGDIFGDDHHPYTITSHEMDSLHKMYRPYLGSICHSIPFYVCLGNHEGEFDYYLAHTPPENMAVYGTLWRKFYYPNPFPNNFYSGNTDFEPYGMGNPENYYSWTWGDALFVVLDAYRYQCDTSAKPHDWDWTLGFTQYTWLKNTLESSTSPYKFVFIHQLRGQGRGGVLDAPYYEWGGYNGNNTWGFDVNRPGWVKPIHQLLVDNGVNILFHGHDHLFSHEVLDGLIYQEVPMPSDSTYEIGMLANGNAYISDTLNGSGHIRVSVSSSCIKVDYVRAYLPADTIEGNHHNREVAFSYTIGNCPSTIGNDLTKNSDLDVFPNPFTNYLSVRNENGDEKYQLVNVFGQSIWSGSHIEKQDFSNLVTGIYILKIYTINSIQTIKLTKQ